MLKASLSVLEVEGPFICSTRAPRNWADLRSEQRTIIPCVDPSYISAIGLPRPQGIIHRLHVVVHMQCMEYGVSISIMGAWADGNPQLGMSLIHHTTLQRLVCHAWRTEYTTGRISF